MPILSKEKSIKIFEETFGVKVKSVYSEGSSISFIDKEYSMEYNFLEGIIYLNKFPERIGVIFISECDIFSENISNDCIYEIGLFEHKLKKFIKLNQKRSRRKFIAK